MIKKTILSAALVASLAVSACANNGNGYGMGEYGNKELVGTGLGAVVGGLAGSQFGKGDGRVAAAVAGGLLGAMLGQSAGRSLDRADMTYLNQASTRAQSAPIGQTINWNNPQSGNYGTVTPVREGTSTSGQYCREYNQTIYVGGQRETAVGTACKNADGTWRVVS